MKIAPGTDLVRVPRLRAVVTAMATLVIIGLAVFLRRYRGADRTAVALSLLVGGGVCFTVGLAWFQLQFGRRIMRRRALRGVGLRYGALAGTLTGGIGIVLLAARWGMDQLASPASDPFLPAFWRALVALGKYLAAGSAAYFATGALLGALLGLFVAEVIGLSADRIPEVGEAVAVEVEPVASSGVER